MSETNQLELLRLKKQLLEYKKYNKLEEYDPYPFQAKFHNDRDLRKNLQSGNQSGKTRAGCVQDAFDLTGLYPDWYEGTRYDHPIGLICGSINDAKTRDLLQKELLGNPIEKEVSLGTGWIPKSCLDPAKMSLKRGVTDAYIHVMVKHSTDGVDDGWSQLTFSSYAAGKEAWMGDTKDVYHLDEEPPMDILGQAGRGCIANDGSIRITYTPENGRTEVVEKLTKGWNSHKATWQDASGGDFDYTFEDGEEISFKEVRTIGGRLGHITEKTLIQAEKDNPPFLMKMRVKGDPVAGSGLVFTHMDNNIKIEPIRLPAHWKRIDAIDFGGSASTSHPTAFCRMAYDEDNDVIYIYDGFRVTGKEIPEIASIIVAKPLSNRVPVIWPHDGNKTLGQGGATKEQYASAGVNMFYNRMNPDKSHFTNPPEKNKMEGTGGIQIMPGITEMSARMNDGRFKVFSTVHDFFEEKQNYHYKDGKIVDKGDDFMSACRYVSQSIRHAVTLEDIAIKINVNTRVGSWQGS